MNARELAANLQVSEATVSRLLSNDRRPSVDLMTRVKEVFPFWSLDDQAVALGAGVYGGILKACMDSNPCSMPGCVLPTGAGWTYTDSPGLHTHTPPETVLDTVVSDPVG